MVGHDTIVVMVRHGGDLSKYSPLLSPCNRAQARGLAWPIPGAVARSTVGTSNFNCPNAPTSLVFLAWKNHLRLSKFWVT